MDQLTLIHALEPRVVERARHLAHAIALIRAGRPAKEVRFEVRRVFQLHRVTAWRLVDVANDLAGPVP